MRHRFIVTGATGKIGSAFINKVGVQNCIGLSRQTKLMGYINIDLSSLNYKTFPNYSEFDTVVHLAAKAHIDNCEEDKIKGKYGPTWVNNVIATNNIVNYCRKTNKKLIYLSTECVFDGKKQKYSEEDKPNPKNWYGVTKLASEKIVSELPNALIFRTVMAYDGGTLHSDIVETFASSLRVGEAVIAAVDQIVSFTYTNDIINAILIGSETELKGIYHFAGHDKLSVYELAVNICKLLGIDRKLVSPRRMESILGKDRAELRLVNSVLDSSKFISKTGYRPTSIMDGLKMSLGISGRSGIITGNND